MRLSSTESEKTQQVDLRNQLARHLAHHGGASGNGDAIMNTCSFKKLVLLLDNKLDLDDKLEVLEHLETCAICRDTVYQISRDRDEDLFVHHPYDVNKIVA
jgi:hypothetical protein